MNAKRNELAAGEAHDVEALMQGIGAGARGPRVVLACANRSEEQGAQRCCCRASESTRRKILRR